MTILIRTAADNCLHHVRDGSPGLLRTQGAIRAKGSCHLDPLYDSTRRLPVCTTLLYPPMERPVIDLQRRNAWMERNYLGLKWSSGTTPYDSIEDILHSHLRLIEKIYVKGREKREWLRSLLQSTHHDMIENLKTTTMTTTTTSSRHYAS